MVHDKHPSGKSGQVNVSVANIYLKNTYHSEIVSQALLGERLRILKIDRDFTEVQLPDDYQGWISNYQWVEEKRTDLPLKKVRKHLVKVFDKASLGASVIRDAVIGVDLPIIEDGPEWSEVLLPDELTGWIKSDAFDKFPVKTRQAIVQLSEEFLGYPYYWGGRSIKGFDCSGLTQTIHALLGIHLPRDAWMQHREAKYVGTDPENAEPGDLYFFAEKGSKITHVSVATGSGRMIHARGYVRENSLVKKDHNFSEELLSTFVDIRTFM